MSQSLQEYGFTKEEADVFIFLSSTGPCPARLVALRFNTNRMKAYRTLKALEEKGLVDRIIGRPVKFVAASLSGVIRKYMQDMKDRLSRLEAREEDVLRIWSTLSDDTPRSLEEPRFRIFQGRQQVYDLLLQMCNRVISDLRIVTTPRDLNRLSYMGFDDRLKELVSRGVHVSLLTIVDEGFIEDVEYYQEFIDVRHIELQSAIRFVIIDRAETIISVSMDDTMSMTTQEDTGLWTDSTSFITAMEVFYESLWGMAPPAWVMIESIKSGIARQEIRIVNSMEEYLSTFQMMIEESQTTLDIMVRQLSDLPLSIDDLEAVITKPVKIRLLTKVDLESFQAFSRVPGLTKVLHNPSETGLLLIIVDGEKTLFNIPQWERMGQAVWSDLDSYVLTMKQVFDDYWRNGLPLQTTILQLKEEQNFENSIDTIATGFRMAGWHAEKNGSIPGSNGTKYPFNLVCRGPDPHYNLVAVELIRKADSMGEIIRVGTYSVNLRNHLVILASMKPFTQKEAELAAIYNILLVFSDNLEELAFRILDHAEKLRS